MIPFFNVPLRQYANMRFINSRFRPHSLLPRRSGNGSRANGPCGAWGGTPTSLPVNLCGCLVPTKHDAGRRSHASIRCSRAEKTTAWNCGQGESFAQLRQMYEADRQEDPITHTVPDCEAPPAYSAANEGNAAPVHPADSSFPAAECVHWQGRGLSKQAGEALPPWAFVLLLLVGWLPYLWTVWPGTVSNDSITQLAEVLGRKPLGNANPLFQTGLVWLAVTVGQGWLGSGDAAVALYVCVQGILLAWLLGYTLRRIAESGAPGWLTGLSAVFFMLCPIFPTFAFCMGKDTAFAMAALWLTLMAWRVLESKWPPLRTTAGLCLSAALCALTRNAGAVLAAATLVGLLLYALAMCCKSVTGSPVTPCAAATSPMRATPITICPSKSPFSV